MDLSGSDRVLEVAAGTCITGRTKAPLVKEVICIDATPAMLEVGRVEAEKNAIFNMRFMAGMAEHLPFEAETFDIVITRLSFHHFAEMKLPFAQMHHVLKPVGKLVIIDMEVIFSLG